MDITDIIWFLNGICTGGLIAIVINLAFSKE